MTVRQKGKKMMYANRFEEYRERLWVESPKASCWLQSMVFGLMAQIDGLNENDALELVCKIIAYQSKETAARS
jgi:hypothetical protein